MTPASKMIVRTRILTGLAMVAFAANSVLCRLALGPDVIDAASFTAIRLISGATTLLIVAPFYSSSSPSETSGDWRSATALFLYASAFSFAYISLSAATGALILFASVQTTMILTALYSGERPHSLEWVGLTIALSGLVYLVFPGLSAPSPLGSVLMIVAGIAWGLYSLLGRSTANPIAVTRGNFIRSVPLVLVVSLVLLQKLQISWEGALLATLSGALASGLGYIIWYAALQGLTTTRAAAVQLSVPVLAALGGVVLLSESVTMRLVISSVTILGGLALVLVGRDFPWGAERTPALE